jgi:uncharacterized protein DUF4386
MTNNKIIARSIGVLLIAQMTAAVLSYSVILPPILHKKDFLDSLSINSTLVTIAMLLDLAVGLSTFGIAVLLYPVLKKYSERMALWFLGLRLNEVINYVIGGVLLLTVLSIGVDYQQVDPSEAEHFEILSTYLLRARGNTQLIGLLIYCFGTSMLYYLLFHTKLIPRFISVWGLIGVILLFAEVISNIFNESLGGLIIMMPLGLNEIFFGIWLIIRGFNPTQTISYAKG